MVMELVTYMSWLALNFIACAVAVGMGVWIWVAMGSNSWVAGPSVSGVILFVSAGAAVVCVYSDASIDLDIVTKMAGGFSGLYLGTIAMYIARRQVPVPADTLAT